MSYAQFLASFLCIPLFAVVLSMRGCYTRRILLALGAISLIALLYTGPWDNLIIINGVWSYGPHQVTGVLIGHVPLEEYTFYVLQVALTGSLTAWLLAHRGR